MAVTTISADFESQIHQIAKDNGGSARKDKIARLEALNELAEPILNDLNSDNLEYINIEAELDSLNKEIEEFNQEMKKVVDEQNADAAEQGTRTTRINELLAQKQTKGLTETEEKELSNLQYQNATASNNQSSYSSQITTLKGNISNKNSQISADYTTLTEISTTMDGYAEAGEKIQTKAMEFGRKNMNCEQIMTRNESSWWSQAAKWAGGAVAVAGLAAGTIATAGGIVGASTMTVGFLRGVGTLGKIGLFAGGAAGAGSLIAGFGSTGKQMQNYLDMVGYQTLDAHSTYYDSTDNAYVSEYQALEAKGGNQVQGKLRQLQCKAYSFGKTINFAAGDVKGKVDALVTNNTTTTNENEKKPDEE